jgi:NAD(P)-dependent dehydrogenase (short-subunit alcohol dehydrogenase family)
MFAGKGAFITGGGTGIGRATTERIVAQGGKAVIAGRREGPLREVAARFPHSIAHVVMDLGDWTAQSRALEHVISRYGRLDILINNAATQTTKLFVDHTEDEIAQIMHINLTSTAVLIHKALPHLIASRGCHLGRWSLLRSAERPDLCLQRHQGGIEPSHARPRLRGRRARRACQCRGTWTHGHRDRRRGLYQPGGRRVLQVHHRAEAHGDAGGCRQGHLLHGQR